MRAAMDLSVNFYPGAYPEEFRDASLPGNTRAHARLSARTYLLTWTLSREAISVPDDAEVRNVKWVVLSKSEIQAGD